MNITELLGVATAAITILGATVGLTRYLVLLQQRSVEQELQGQVNRASDKLHDLEERLKLEQASGERRYKDLDVRYKELVDEVAMSVRIGTQALVRKRDIDDHLIALMKRMQAGAGSVYVPAPPSTPSETVDALMFLSIQPLGVEAAALRKKTIPMQSLAGRCFATGEPFVRADTSNDRDHFTSADLVSGYSTEDVLSLPIKERDRTVAVLQLLNKDDGTRFTEADVPRASLLMDTLVKRVLDYVGDAQNLQILGVPADASNKKATILFCDLTRSSAIFQELNTSSSIQHLNEFFETVCGIALARGASIDKYMGDGVLMRFSPPQTAHAAQPVTGSPYDAAQAAVGMVEGFEELKRSWVTMGELLTGIFLRVGLATGDVNEAIVGHPQRQDLTVIGKPVSVAVNLCESATRERNIIIVNDIFKEALSDRATFSRVPDEELGKARRLTEGAYELQALTAY